MAGSGVPAPGNVVYAGAAASVQFAGDRALILRVIRVHDWPTYHGWCWLDAYVLDRTGQACDRRTVFVQVAGLRPAVPPPPPRRPPRPRRRAGK